MQLQPLKKYIIPVLLIYLGVIKSSEKELPRSADSKNHEKAQKQPNENSVMQMDDKKMGVQQSSTPAQNSKQEVQKENTSEVITPSKNQEENKKLERTISVSNQITESMTTYRKHWTGNYTPSKFTVTINDQELKKDGSLQIPIKDDTVHVVYNYEFKVLGRVQRAGGKKITFRVPQDTEKLVSTFSWDAAPSNLILDKAHVVSMQDIGQS